MSEIVVVEGAAKTFRRGVEEVRAIDSVDLTIEQGELLAIVGPSGSGKTTLLNLIGCVDRPTSGRVTVHGMETGELTDKALATIRSTTIGFVFQSFFLVPTLTALENVMVPGRFSAKREPQGNIEERARLLLANLGLENREDHLPSELSGGEMQRVAVARALINQPEILLADEPTGNLDMKNAQEIASILEELNADGLTVVIVTHNPDLVTGASRIIRLEDGRIAEEHRIREIGHRSVQETGDHKVLVAPDYMPSNVIKRKWGSPRVAALIAMLGVAMFAVAFMPFVEKRTGSGLLSQGLFTMAIYRGNEVTKLYYGKPATILTGFWPMVLGSLLIVGAALFVLKRSRISGWISATVGGLAVIVGVINLIMIASRLGTNTAIGFTGMNPGYGLWVLVGTGICALALGIWILVGYKQPAGPEQPENAESA